MGCAVKDLPITLTITILLLLLVIIILIISTYYTIAYVL